MSGSIDQSIAGILRAVSKTDLAAADEEKARRKSEALGRNLRDHAIGEEVRSLIEMMVTAIRQPDPQRIKAAIERTTRRGWRKTSEVILLQLASTFDSEDPKELLELTPTGKALAVLSKRNTGLKKEAAATALANPMAAYETPVADWLVTAGKIDSAEQVFVAILHGEKRPHGLASADELLRAAVERDKKGALLNLVLSRGTSDHKSITRYAATLLQMPKALARVIEALQIPKLLKRYESAASALLQAIVVIALTDKGRPLESRRNASLALIRLIAGILLGYPAGKPEPMLVFKAREALDDLGRGADSELTKVETWTMHSLNANTSPPTTALISPEAAKVFTIAFENLSPDTDTLTLLEATMFNLGLSPDETPGEYTPYDPLRHEDISGSLWPGDSVEILRKGWSLAGRTIVRAQVKASLFNTMAYEPVLSIDLGASYTKIAVRRKKAAADNQTFCSKFVGQIPSLGIHDTSKGHNRWLFGEEAAEMPPNADWQSHDNWKSKLFIEAAGAASADGAIVANHFFTWLHGWLKEKGINPDAQRVRVCVPELTYVEPYATTLAHIMDRSGWGRVQILKVSEPQANSVGLLSCGRNCIQQNHTPGYGDMFGRSGLYAGWVDRALNPWDPRGGRLRVAVLDVGSFTTDVAGIIISFAAQNASGIETRLQKSWAHGIIDQLDARVLPAIFKRHNAAWELTPFKTREQTKKPLYANQQYSLTTGQILGDLTDQKAISEGIADFCTELWRLVSPDLEEFHPEFCFLTGGGSQIESLRSEIKHRLARLGCRLVPVPPSDENANCADEPPERVATALGATSVILDASDAGPTSAPAPLGARPPGQKPCVCNANKDCCRCFGRGYVDDDER